MTAKKTSGESAFSKEQLLQSKRYKENRDILDALLEDNRTYTFADVDGMLQKFKERKVK